SPRRPTLRPATQCSELAPALRVKFARRALAGIRRASGRPPPVSCTSVPRSAIGLHLVLSPFPLRASLKYLASVRCGESSIHPEPVLVQTGVFSGRFCRSGSFCPLQAFCPQTQLQFLRTQHPFDPSRELF